MTDGAELIVVADGPGRDGGRSQHDNPLYARRRHSDHRV
jgi:hypothetical protein